MLSYIKKLLFGENCVPTKPDNLPPPPPFSSRVTSPPPRPPGPLKPLSAAKQPKKSDVAEDDITPLVVGAIAASVLMDDSSNLVDNISVDCGSSFDAGESFDADGF